jgi:D-aspartate ligase
VPVTGSTHLIEASEVEERRSELIAMRPDARGDLPPGRLPIGKILDPSVPRPKSVQHPARPPLDLRGDHSGGDATGIKSSALRETAIVAEVGWVNGLAAIRSLGRAGVRVLAVDHRPWALGFSSRYAERMISPDAARDEDEFVAFLRRLAEGFDAPVPIFPTHDEHLTVLSRRRTELQDRYRFPFPGWDVLEPILSKRHQLEVAERAGVAVPRTFHPRSAEEAAAAAAVTGYPVFLKPSSQRTFRALHNRQGFVCTSAAELGEAYETMAAHEPMLQEFVPGDDDQLYTLGSYIGVDGEVLGIFSGRKLRQTGNGMGTARVGVSLWVNDVVEQGLALLRELGFHGLSQVEFKLDPRTGEFKLMEVNARLWQWHGLASACGVDFPVIAHHDLLGRRERPRRMTADGKVWAITFMAGTPPAFQRPPYVDAVFARDDLRPFWTQVKRLAAAAWTRRRRPAEAAAV